VDCGLWIVDCGLWIVDCGLWIVDCGLWIVDCGLRIADCGLWIVDLTYNYLGSQQKHGDDTTKHAREWWRATPRKPDHSASQSTQVVAKRALSPQALKQLLEAPDLKAALTLAKGCPIVASGGSVDVAEAMDM